MLCYLLTVNVINASSVEGQKCFVVSTSFNLLSQCVVSSHAASHLQLVFYFPRNRKSHIKMQVQLDASRIHETFYRFPKRTVTSFLWNIGIHQRCIPLKTLKYNNNLSWYETIHIVTIGSLQGGVT